ncbi:MAG: polysaccharide deacetylase family protein [Verrucomicrobia bacterium]|nr:polysaccharide deacetylase family protein [Verrucomicrobiota bacterium]
MVLAATVVDGAVASPVDRVPTALRAVALTFDDGPDPQSLRIMDLLENINGRATFFVTGKSIEKHPDVLRAIFARGHEIGNHTLSHPRLSQLSPESIEHEILGTQQLVKDLTGQVPVIFRAPFLSYNDSVLFILQRAQLPAINGTLTRDWDPSTSVEEIIAKSTGNIQPGAIIVLHSWSANTLAALPEILRLLQEQDFRLVTVSELLASQE